MGKLIAACTLMAALFAMPIPSAAQGTMPSQADRERVRDCVNSHGELDALRQAADCVGKITDLCRNQQTTEESLACYEGHTAVWDMLLNDWYGQARKKLDARASEALKQAQMAWIAFRDAKCGFWTTRYDGSYRAIIGADCLQSETGRRTLEMHEIWKEASL